jgi:hypothetical protein
MNSKPILSHHLFLFPFTLENRTPEKSAGFMESVTRALSPQWRERFFSPEESNLKYSEYVYYHPFIRSALFSRKEDAALPFIRYFTPKETETGEFTIHIKDRSEPYRLDIRHIALRIFDTRIGILSLELVNTRYPAMEDILLMNDYGRRIYPQFLDENTGKEGTQGAFLPETVFFQMGNETLTEDFDEERFRKPHPVVAAYIDHLLGENFTTDPARFKESKNRFLYKPTVDDRMYTVCWYGSDEVSEVLTHRDPDQNRYAYEDSDTWFQFVFMDGRSPTCQHFRMKHRLIEEATYERWTEWGTLYGISRYGFTCLTNRGWFPTHILRQHMRRQYAQLAVLVLAQRASILRFSESVTDISRRIKGLEKATRRGDRKDLDAIAADVETLHGAYIRFINRLWFSEVTPQDQGIEMYHQMVRMMRLNTDLEELREEIKELYEYVGITQERSANTQMYYLTLMGALFLPLTVLTGFLGMNLFIVDNPFLQNLFKPTAPQFWHWLFSFLIFIGLTFVLYAGVRGIINTIDRAHHPLTHYLKLSYWISVFLKRE